MQRRRLGASDLEVSRLSLGSWRTFERISRDAGLAVMRAAREHGINFLDDARYNDETGSAPIPTGYSEVLFALAQDVGVSASALAIAFALANPAVATVLFGATSPEQIAENVTALGVDGATVQRLVAD